MKAVKYLVLAALCAVVFFQHKAYVELDREAALQRRFRNEVRRAERPFCTIWNKKTTTAKHEEACAILGVPKGDCETCIGTGWEE